MSFERGLIKPSLGADITAVLQANQSLHRKLLSAVSNNHIGVVKRLLGSESAPAHAIGPNGNTPLHLAASKNYHELVYQMRRLSVCFFELPNNLGQRAIDLTCDTVTIQLIDCKNPISPRSVRAQSTLSIRSELSILKKWYEESLGQIENLTQTVTLLQMQQTQMSRAILNQCPALHYRLQLEKLLANPDGKQSVVSFYDRLVSLLRITTNAYLMLSTGKFARSTSARDAVSEETISGSQTAAAVLLGLVPIAGSSLAAASKIPADMANRTAKKALDHKKFEQFTKVARMYNRSSADSEKINAELAFYIASFLRQLIIFKVDEFFNSVDIEIVDAWFEYVKSENFTDDQILSPVPFLCYLYSKKFDRSLEHNDKAELNLKSIISLSGIALLGTTRHEYLRGLRTRKDDKNHYLAAKEVTNTARYGYLVCTQRGIFLRLKELREGQWNQLSTTKDRTRWDSSSPITGPIKNHRGKWPDELVLPLNNGGFDDDN